jgi:hypothetical protein
MHQDEIEGRKRKSLDGLISETPYSWYLSVYMRIAKQMGTRKRSATEGVGRQISQTTNAYEWKKHRMSVLQPPLDVLGQ